MKSVTGYRKPLLIAGLIGICLIGILYFFSVYTDSINKNRSLVLVRLLDENFQNPVLVERDLKSKDQFKWNSEFTYQFHDGNLKVKIRISAVANSRIKGRNIAQLKQQWEKIIEDTWNNKLVLSNLENEAVPIIFDAIFTHVNPNHRVIIKNSGGIDQHGWTINMLPQAAAHEFGHMLGAYDEYKEGASSPLTKIDGTSIMGANIENGHVYPEHLHILLEDLKRVLKEETLQIIKKGK